MRFPRKCLSLALWLPLFSLFAPALFAAESAPLRWWKGNLHTHSLWSDGDDYPEMIVEWYKKHGYNFLAMSEHNIVMTGTKWTVVTTNANSAEAFNKYMRRFGTNWVEWRYQDGKVKVKLKTLPKFRTLFEQPGKFILVPGEEITAAYKQAPVHLNATNLRYLIRPRSGTSVLEVLQRNVDSVLKQRAETGQPMIPHINHPNFGWALTAEDLMRVKGEKFFEVYNGHPLVHNEGDPTHPSMERMWDIALAMRLTELGLETLYGLAVDDSHHYHKMEIGRANAGRGWIMVRASSLTPESLIQAMEAGDFYSSSGVRLRDVVRGTEQYRIHIEPEPGVTYTTTFYGTRRGFDPSSQPTLAPNGVPLEVSRQYSAAIGEKLAEAHGPIAAYTIRGDEIYVRATVVSSKKKANPYVKDEFEKAWTQPLVPSSRGK